MLMALSVIPSIILFAIVWKFDTVEKEPPKLLWKLFFFGALTIISASVIGLLGQYLLLGGVFPDEKSYIYLFIDNFILTALVEEGGKFFVLKKVTWKNKEFNYTFDAVVYAVVVSLGFATFENILYVFDGGIGTALARAVLSVPGHVIDAVFMGYFYGLARYAQGAGDRAKEKSYLFMSLFIPVVMHGFYDFCLSADRGIFYILFVVYEILITVITIRQFIKLSKNDMLIPGMEAYPAEGNPPMEESTIQEDNSTEE